MVLPELLPWLFTLHGTHDHRISAQQSPQWHQDFMQVNDPRVVANLWPALSCTQQLRGSTIQDVHSLGYTNEDVCDIVSLVITGAIWLTQSIEHAMAYVMVLDSLILDTVGPLPIAAVWAKMTSEDRWIVRNSIRSATSVLDGQQCPPLIGIRRVRWLVAHGHSDTSVPQRDPTTLMSEMVARESWGDFSTSDPLASKWDGREPFTTLVLRSLDYLTGWRHPGL